MTRAGINVCDSRRPLHETRAAFPGVDFSLVTSGDEDVWWREAHKDVNASGEYALGESEAACTARGVRFLKWLMTRRARGLYTQTLHDAANCGGARRGCGAPRLHPPQPGAIHTQGLETLSRVCTLERVTQAGGKHRGRCEHERPLAHAVRVSNHRGYICKTL